MNIDDLQVRTPYKVTASKYQFEVGDKVYLYDRNTLMLQEAEEELHRVELVGGLRGFAVTGMTGGLLLLNELSDEEDCPEIMEPGTDVRTFLRIYDKTEFEMDFSMAYQGDSYRAKLISSGLPANTL